jgi:tellurite resistance protein
MSDNSNLTVRAVQESVLNLLELVEQAARGQNPQEVEALCDEAQQTVLKMIAAIVLADKKYDAGEQAFLNLLVDWRKKPGGEMQYVNEFAEGWRVASMQVPYFFQAAADHDTRQHTELARAIMREIQLIGNNTCVSDGQFEATEHEVVRNYILFLEEYLEAWRAEQGAPAKDLTEGWKSV